VVFLEQEFGYLPVISFSGQSHANENVTERIAFAGIVREAAIVAPIDDPGSEDPDGLVELSRSNDPCYKKNINIMFSEK
jgi:hypothetical protein